MYFKFSGRTNPKSKIYDSYYRLVESYRNADERVCHRTILNIGFIDDELSAEQLNIIARTLTEVNYFHRTSLDMKEEVLVWNVYNTIRKIKATFRTLMTDLISIYHKNDNSTLAHLHLGLLAYWLVNTIRCQLKINGITNNWREIVRIGNTQKVITTSGYNKTGVQIKVRKCSQPEAKLRQLHQALAIKPRPFT